MRVRISENSAILLAAFLLLGSIAFRYAWSTVHSRPPQELAAQSGAIRSHAIVNVWMTQGYFASHGLLFPAPPSVKQRIIYTSSTGGFMISAFLAEKIWHAFTGRYSWRLMALHNEFISLLSASLLALLAYRIARRFAIEPLSAFALAVAAEMVAFTFPDNLFLYWEISAQAYFILFAIVFLLFEERERTLTTTVAQAIAAFLMTYMEFICGTFFIAAYIVIALLLRDERPPLRRLAVMLVLPWLVAMAIFQLQLAAGRRDAETSGGRAVGASFISRTGLDGDTKYYRDHLDIINGREVARVNWPKNREHLFLWKWLFISGIVSLLSIFAAYLRGRSPHIALVALMSMIGSYVLYAAVFSQGIVIHPYLYDVLIATPIILAAFAVWPALIESLTHRSGVFVVITLFVAIWYSMYQLRLYALRYPLPPPPPLH